MFNVVNLHLYHYAGNNPIKYVDPDGRESEDKPTFLSLIEALNFIKDNVKTKAEQTIFSVLYVYVQNGRIRFVDMTKELSIDEWSTLGCLHKNDRTGQYEILISDIVSDMDDLIEVLFHEGVHATHKFLGHENNMIAEDVDAYRCI
ncbi:MAG: hypothetical protein P1P59_04180 [Treponemataceae bacterium]